MTEPTRARGNDRGSSPDRQASPVDERRDRIKGALADALDLNAGEQSVVADAVLAVLSSSGEDHAEVERLRGELASLRASFERLIESRNDWNDAAVKHYGRAEDAEAALAVERARVQRVEALADEWGALVRRLYHDDGAPREAGRVMGCLTSLRAALSGDTEVEGLPAEPGTPDTEGDVAPSVAPETTSERFQYPPSAGDEIGRRYVEHAGSTPAPVAPVRGDHGQDAPDPLPDGAAPPSLAADDEISPLALTLWGIRDHLRHHLGCLEKRGVGDLGDECALRNIVQRYGDRRATPTPSEAPKEGG